MMVSFLCIHVHIAPTIYKSFQKCGEVVGKLKKLTHLHGHSVVLTVFTFPQIINIPCRRFQLNGIGYMYLVKLEDINWDGQLLYLE